MLRSVLWGSAISPYKIQTAACTLGINLMQIRYIKCRLQTGYKMQTDTITVFVNNTINFPFLTHGNVTQSPFRDQPKQLPGFLWCHYFDVAVSPDIYAFCFLSSYRKKFRYMIS